MKNLMNQSANQVNIIGKLLEVSVSEGKTSDGREYIRAVPVIRVQQICTNKEEINEIPVSMFAFKYKNDNSPNPGYSGLLKIKQAKTIQNSGEAEADYVQVKNCSVGENTFVTKGGQLITGWQFRCPFLTSVTNCKEIASFSVDAYIMDIHPELDREGDETGRLIIKGAVVQYGGNLDILEFVVESNDYIEFIERNWNINDTVNIAGRIRVTSKENTHISSHSSWGEQLPEVTTVFVRELVVTSGSDTPFDEDFSYDPNEIKKGFNARKAKIEQLQIDAKSTKEKKEANAPEKSSKYSWE